MKSPKCRSIPVDRAERTRRIPEMSNPGNKNQIIWDTLDGNLNPGE